MLAHDQRTFSVFLLSACCALSCRTVWAATRTAASCNLSDVQSAVNASVAGDTVQVPAGSATWSTTLTFSKNISLIGAGIGNTVITGSASPMIVYNPVNNSDLFRISGFTFNANNKQVIQLNNNSLYPPIYQVRIDHNRFAGSTTLPGGGIENFGVRGVVDNNTFDNMRGGARAWGDNSGVGAFDWSHYPPLVFGAPNDNFYFEDNTFNLTSGAYMISDCDQGGRYVYRYNTFNSATDMYPWLDYHGGRGSTYSCWSGEIYGNVYSRSGFLVSWRGGRIAFFNNSLGAGSGSFNVYNNDGCPSTAPQRHNDGYSWGSRSGTSGALIPFSSSGGDVCGDVVENSTYWLDNTACEAPQTCANITSGVGCGTLANRPAGCTPGTAYWATNQSCSNLTGMIGPNPATPISGTLYQCTATNTWTAFYTPMPYPHPLRSAGTPPPSGSACDVNKDNTTNIVDVQQCVNQSLGVATCTADINKDGVCNVIDVQRVVNAALGGQCVSP